jgi:hypothetical protein
VEGVLPLWFLFAFTAQKRETVVKAGQGLVAYLSRELIKNKNK